MKKIQKKSQRKKVKNQRKYIEKMAHPLGILKWVHLNHFRLWVKAVFLGYRRSKAKQNENQALLKIQGVESRRATHFYWGKRVAFVYKGHNKIKDKKYRVSFI